MDTHKITTGSSSCMTGQLEQIVQNKSESENTYKNHYFATFLQIRSHGVPKRGHGKLPYKGYMCLIGLCITLFFCFHLLDLGLDIELSDLESLHFYCYHL
jgi:hypothetical protein